MYYYYYYFHYLLLFLYFDRASLQKIANIDNIPGVDISAPGLIGPPPMIGFPECLVKRRFLHFNTVRLS